MVDAKVEKRHRVEAFDMVDGPFCDEGSIAQALANAEARGRAAERADVVAAWGRMGAVEWDRYIASLANAGAADV